MEQSTVSLLTEKRLLLEEMRSLARMQTELLTEESPERLLASMGRQNSIMQLVDAVDAKLSGRHPENDPLCASLLKEIEVILGDIIKTDGANSLVAGTVMGQLRGDLRRARDSDRQTKAYDTAAQPVEGLFFDRRE